jgi:hypothetical protein
MSLLCLCHAIHQLGRQVIYTIVRIITPEDLEWYLEDCLSLKQKYPDVLAGSYKLRRQRMKAKSLTAFDVVGPEEVAYPLIHYINPLLAFREKCNSIGVDLPFLFHAGETLGDGGFVSFCFYRVYTMTRKQRRSESIRRHSSRNKAHWPRVLIDQTSHSHAVVSGTTDLL